MLRQLLNYIEDYLTGRCLLRDLETWLVSNLQQILDLGDTSTIEVANQVDADLVELGEGLIDEAILRERLERYMRLRKTIPHMFSEIEQPLATTCSTAIDQTIRGRVEVTARVVDFRLSHVFA